MCLGVPGRVVLLVPFPIGRDVARVADRNRVMGRSVPQIIAYLERAGLLAHLLEGEIRMEPRGMAAVFNIEIK